MMCVDENFPVKQVCFIEIALVGNLSRIRYSIFSFVVLRGGEGEGEIEIEI
jgi:hypothetical protein